MQLKEARNVSVRQQRPVPADLTGPQRTINELETSRLFSPCSGGAASYGAGERTIDVRVVLRRREELVKASEHYKQLSCSERTTNYLRQTNY